MYGNQYMIENLNRQKEKIDEMIRNCQQPTSNFIGNTQTPSNDSVILRVLNENEEVDNLYVSNKTLFINDNNMVLKGVDGKLEKWEIKKIYPIDKKDEKINQLEEEIRSLKEMLNNEYSKSNKSTIDVEQPNVANDVNIESKSKTNSKYVSK